MFHREALGVGSANLDTFFMRKGLYPPEASEGCKGAELAVLEGVMGYYDGIGGISDGASSYEVADATGTPVVLVVDGRGKSLSLVAEIQDSNSEKPYPGVILNRISPSIYLRLKQ